jgi:hypothetical protein
MIKKLKNSLRLKRLLVNTLETYYLFLDSIKIIISSLANLFFKGKLYDKELIFITGSDRFFFESLLQLVESVNMHEQKPKIVVYDLGLEEFQIKQLKETYDNLEYRKFNFSAYPNFFEERDEFGKLGAYAWKSAIISEIFYEKKTNIIWLDAGNTISKRLTLLRIVLTFNGFYSPISSGRIEDWTYPSVLNDLNIDKKFRKKRNLTGGIVGLSWGNNSSENIINSWSEFSLKKDLISPKGSNRENHRQDQSLLSIVSYRIKSPSTFLKTKKLFSIQVNQNPGKRVYLSESYGDKNAFNFRSDWYKVNDSLSTNTIKYAYFIFITDIKYWKKIQKKYLKNKYIILKFSEGYEINNKNVIKDILKLKKYVDVYLVESKNEMESLKKLGLENIQYIEKPYNLENYTHKFEELIKSI